MAQNKDLESILRETVRRILTDIPGGGLTDLGALRRIHPLAWAGRIRSAMETDEGDVEDAANRLDVSPRTVYNALQEPELASVKTKAELEDAEEEKEEKKEKSIKKQRDEKK